MYSEKLVEPLSDAGHAGEEALHSVAYQQLTEMADYLGAKLAVLEFERAARQQFDGENARSDELVAQAKLEDGRRNVARLESAVKESLGRAARPETVRDEVSRRAEQLLVESGKDLRIVQHLALAWLMQRGVDGLRDSLRLVADLIDRFGAELHPKADEDDPSDFMARELVVSEILNGDAVLAALRESTLLEAKGVGRFSCRDSDVIDGKLAEDGSGGVRSVADLMAIAKAIGQANGRPPEAELAGVSSAIDQCLAAAGEVRKRLGPRAAVGDRVLKQLERSRALLEAAGRELSAGSESSDEGQETATASTGAANMGAARQGQFGALRNRDDARRQILEISRFLEQTEPSHPAPLLLRRAERLLGARDFFAIVRDIAPDAISEVERITGHRESTPETQ